MAFVLKKPLGGSKGIVVFTHKEIQFFTDPDDLTDEAIGRLRQHFVLGLHWGHFRADVKPPTTIDFHLAGPGTVQFSADAKARHISLCSRNFIPPIFRPDGGPKFWDILMIARPLRLKKIDEFFQVLKAVLARRPHTTALLISPFPRDIDDDGLYSELVDDYKRLFSDQERENVTVLATDGAMYPFPISQTALAFFYNRSRVFTLFSEQEGESRVISEALLCGLPVVARRDLRGGGRDYLNDANSLLFSTSAEAADMLTEALESPQCFSISPEALARDLRSDYSIHALVLALRQLFAELGIPFDGELHAEGLDRKLPGHCHLLPDRWRSPFTDDLNSVVSLREFAQELSQGRDFTRSAAGVSAAPPSNSNGRLASARGGWRRWFTRQLLRSP